MPFHTDNGDDVTAQEKAAIVALERLAKKWPRTLTLASMGGSLIVVHSNDERFDTDLPVNRAEAVLFTTLDIPNTGGDW